MAATAIVDGVKKVFVNGEWINDNKPVLLKPIKKIEHKG